MYKIKLPSHCATTEHERFSKKMKNEKEEILTSWKLMKFSASDKRQI